MARGVFRKVATIALGSCLALAAVPAAAQFSDSYNFLKAIKERDGTAATKFLSEPGSTIVNTKDKTTGDSALHLVVARRDTVWMQWLIGKGANVNARNARGQTPLQIASDLGYVEGVETLLKYGARVDEQNATGETPLVSAVHRRDGTLVRLLLKNGANADRADNSGRSARDYAALMGAGAGMVAEIERGEAERKKAGPSAEGTYGPGA